MKQQLKIFLLVPAIAIVLQGCQSNYSQRNLNKEPTAVGTSKSKSKTAASFFNKQIHKLSAKKQTQNIEATQEELVSTVQSYIGIPYVYGGKGIKGLDCSSLMQSSYAKLGIAIPRTADAQFNASNKKSEPEPGDLLFFDIKNNGRISHVGMYIGDGKMVHASTSKKKVKTSDINIRYWQTKLKGVGSFF